jgi:hypothetical protein
MIAQRLVCARRQAGSSWKTKSCLTRLQQDKYLALYIRYSQVASDYQNSDNWFGFGLYKALLAAGDRQV